MLKCTKFGCGLNLYTSGLLSFCYRWTHNRVAQIKYHRTDVLSVTQVTQELCNYRQKWSNNSVHGYIKGTV